MNRASVRLCAFIGTIVSGAPALALAQQAGPQQAGPLSIGFTAAVVYDTNVAKSDAVTAAQRGLKREDVHFTPTINVDLTHALGREQLFLNASFGYDFYDRDRILNRERLDFDGGIRGRIGPCTGTVEGTYARHQSDLGDLSLGITRNVESVSTVSADTACGRSIGLQPTLSLSQTWATNSNDLLLDSDYHSFMVSGGLAYARPSLGKLSVFGQYTQTTYANRGLPALLGGGSDGYGQYAGGVRFNRQLGARIQGMVEISYTALRPYAGSERDFNGLTYSGDLTYRVSSRLKAHFSLKRSVDPSNRLNSTYSTDKTYLLDGTYALGPRLRLNAGASWTDQRYQAISLSPTFDLTSQTTKAIFGDINYKLGRRISVNFNVRREWRTANIAALSYKDTQVGITTGVRF